MVDLKWKSFIFFGLFLLSFSLFGKERQAIKKESHYIEKKFQDYIVRLRSDFLNGPAPPRFVRSGVRRRPPAAAPRQRDIRSG